MKIDDWSGEEKECSFILGKGCYCTTQCYSICDERYALRFKFPLFIGIKSFNTVSWDGNPNNPPGISYADFVVIYPDGEIEELKKIHPLLDRCELETLLMFPDEETSYIESIETYAHYIIKQMKLNDVKIDEECYEYINTHQWINDQRIVNNWTQMKKLLKNK